MSEPQKKFTFTALKLGEISLVDVPAEENALIHVRKAKTPPSNPTNDKDRVMDEKLAQMTADIEKAHATAAALKSERDAALADVEVLKVAKAKLETKVEKARKGEEIDDPYEGLPEWQVEKLKASEDVIKRQTRQLKELEEAQRLSAFEKQARTEFAGLSGTAADIADVLKAVAEIKDEDLRTKVNKTLKTASDAVTEFTKAQGVAGFSEAVFGGVSEKIEELAKARVEANGISLEKARLDVMNEHGDTLYNEYLRDETAAITAH